MDNLKEWEAKHTRTRDVISDFKKVMFKHGVTKSIFLFYLNGEGMFIRSGTTEFVFNMLNTKERYQRFR